MTKPTVGEMLYGPDQLDPEPRLKCYRVWMKDGYASLHDAPSEGVAKAMAIKLADDNTKLLAITKWERRKAMTVDCVDCLSD